MPPATSRRSRIASGRSLAWRVICTAVIIIEAFTVTAMVGWLLHIRVLTSIVPGWPTMKFNTALGMSAGGIALLLSARSQHPEGRPHREALRWLSVLFAIIPLSLGGFIVFEYATGIPVGIHEFAASDPFPNGVTVPGRPAPGTALGVMLSGVALVVWRWPGALRSCTACGLGIAALGWLGLSSLIYGVRWQAPTAFFGTTSLPTTVTLITMAIGLFFLRPREGMMRLLAGNRRAARVTRLILPGAALLTLLMGEIRLMAQRYWDFSLEFGAALHGGTLLLFFTLLALYGAFVLDRIERRQRAAQKKLAANETLLRQFIKHTPAALAMLDNRMRYLEVSERWIRDYHLDGQNIIGRSHYEVFPDIPERWKQVHQRVLAGAVEACDEDPFPRENGGVEWLQWEARPWRRSSGDIGGLIFFTQVITARKEAEERLRESEERFRSAMEYSAIGIAIVGLDGKWLHVNRALCNMVGYSETDLLKLTFQDITHPDDLLEDLDHVRKLLEGKITHYRMEKRYFHRNGHIVWVLLSVALMRKADGSPAYFISQIQDFTAWHDAREKINASLAEKEVLLREIHHRVKNNMQVISSLLQLQSDYLHDKRDVGIFRECQMRIHSMSLVHDRLYRSQNLSTVDFAEYLRELAKLIARSFAAENRRVAVFVHAEPIRLDLDIAIPLGLIATELITNAYKHAFTGRSHGQVDVRLEQESETRLCLIVEDDGSGLPQDLEISKATSLGLRLIQTLAWQLRAELRLESTPKTRILVRVAREHPSPDNPS